MFVGLIPTQALIAGVGSSTGAHSLKIERRTGTGCSMLLTKAFLREAISVGRRTEWLIIISWQVKASADGMPGTSLGHNQ